MNRDTFCESKSHNEVNISQSFKLQLRTWQVNIRGSLKWNCSPCLAHIDYSSAAIKSNNRLIETGKKVNRNKVNLSITIPPTLKVRSFNRLKEVDSMNKETKLTAHDWSVWVWSCWLCKISLTGYSLATRALTVFVCVWLGESKNSKKYTAVCTWPARRN